jgi:fused-like protein
VLLKDHVEAEQFMILIMEYAPKDLAGILKQAVKMKEEDVRRFAKEILSALRYLSDNRIVHRDLKPQNILLNEANVIKICDFGFARKMSAATVCLHSMKGTPLYIAPEIIEMKPYGYKIDIWSLGIIMYELFAGVPPFIADSLQRLAPKIIHDKVVYPNNMAVELRELIQGMLQKNPTNRYDWIDLEKHPFFNPPPPPPPKAVEPVIKVLEP